MKYCIINATDRAKDNVKDIRNKMKDFYFINNIRYYTPKDNYLEYLQENKIDIRLSDRYIVLDTNIAYWASTVSVWNYIIDNNIDKFLVFEDDSVLKDNFVDVYNKCITDLPEDFDSLSLHTLKFNDLVQNVLRDDYDIGSKYIHRALDIIAGAQAMVYSLKGAKKYIQLLQEYGIDTNSDIGIFDHVRAGRIEGYILRPDIPEILTHGQFESALDPENKRNVIFE